MIRSTQRSQGEATLGGDCDEVETMPGWFSPADAQSFAYVANQGSSTVSVVNTANNTVAAMVPVGASPFGVAIASNAAFAYLANAGSPMLSMIDTASNTVVGARVGAFCRVAITQVHLYSVCFPYDPTRATPRLGQPVVTFSA